MMPDLELPLYRTLREVSAYLEHVRDDEKVLKHCVRAARELLGATHGCIAVPASPVEARVEYETPAEGPWDLELLSGFLRGEPAAYPNHTLIVPLRRRKRRWAALALRKMDGAFDRSNLRVLAAVADHVTGILDRIDHERLEQVRGRIDRKIMEQLRPRDLFYQILDALRTLTRYDHSSALLMTTESGESLELAAEQVAWLKGPSRRIGMRLPLESSVRSRMCEGGVIHYVRSGDEWSDMAGCTDAGLAQLLDYNRSSTVESGPREESIVVAPLATRDGVIGLIKIGAVRRGTFGDYEIDVVRQFTCQASVAVQYWQRVESLKARMVEAERKHVIANVARGVSHDVNNALGSILPLVQQMVHDAQAGQMASDTFVADLRQIENALQVCCRIFRGMLQIGRPADQKIGHANVRRAVESTLAILRNGLDSSRVRVDLAIADDLPLVRGGQGDLEQLFLNLSTNARDAMPDGGRLAVTASADDDQVEVILEDSGCGIPAERLAHIFEPFFTTKATGNGLGLSICRSIVSGMHGDLNITSEPGAGTRVWIRLPAVREGESTP